MLGIAAAAALVVLAAAPAHAEGEARDLCANRPGRGSPPCLLDAGRFQVEASFIDFTHDRQTGTTTAAIGRPAATTAHFAVLGRV